MADIILKDRSGTENEHRGVTQLKVPCKNGDGSMTECTFTHMSGLYAYACKPLGDSVLITKKFSKLSNDSLWFFGFTENELKEFGYQHTDGTYAAQIFITTRDDLVVGNTYTTGEYT